MRFNEFKIVNEKLGPATAQPGAPSTKDKLGSFVIDVPKGRSGIEVADVQKTLIALGYPLPKFGVDGIRGPETVAAVKQFQQDNALTVDGDPGPATVAKLNDVLKSKPDVASKLTKSTTADVKAAPSAAKVDVSAIQDPDFNKKLEKIASALGVSSKHLVAIMKQESGVNPAAVNSMSGATGLIQFMPKTAASLGTTTAELKNMSAVEQLDYVYKYFKMVGVKPGMDLGDLYMAVFMPKFVGYPDDFVLGQLGGDKVPGTNLSSDLVYKQNKSLDKNKDGTITVADVKSSVQRFA
jgi:peptidoglycan hydrolase-like protein with peptidoglycan-binding domain